MTNSQVCRYCDGELEEQLVTRLQRYENRWVIIENVPSLVCQQCGEQYFSPSAHDLVLELVQGQPNRIESVDVFDAHAS